MSFRSFCFCLLKEDGELSVRAIFGVVWVSGNAVVVEPDTPLQTGRLGVGCLKVDVAVFLHDNVKVAPFSATARGKETAVSFLDGQVVPALVLELEVATVLLDGKLGVRACVSNMSRRCARKSA